jgi:UDP-glucuronate decarboxylase
MTKKVVLLTGAAGFLGSHITSKLLHNGNAVVGVDNFLSGRQENINKFLGNPSYEFIEHDIVNSYDYSQKPDYILNFACPASPIQYQIDPIKTIETIFLGTMNMLRIAVSYKIPMIQASTSEIYGDPKISPQTEEYWGNVNPIGVRACYDEGKRAAETLCFDYKRQYGVDVKVIRIFNTYGPNMAINDGRVVSNFITQALKNEPLTVYGKGDQTRSLCYVSDLVEGISKLVEHKGEVNTPINLGNPNELTVEMLAKKILEITNSKSRIEYLPLPSDDPKQRCPSIEKAKSLLDWHPKVSLGVGLSKTINYFRSIMK